MPELAFLTNHARALGCIVERPKATGREIAEAINITGRAARRIIVDLDTAGYITKKKEGRGTGMF
jgi:hypothetical protein